MKRNLSSKLQVNFFVDYNKRLKMKTEQMKKKLKKDYVGNE